MNAKLTAKQAQVLRYVGTSLEERRAKLLTIHRYNASVRVLARLGLMAPNSLKPESLTDAGREWLAANAETPIEDKSETATDTFGRPALVVTVGAVTYAVTSVDEFGAIHTMHGVHNPGDVAELDAAVYESGKWAFARKPKTAPLPGVAAAVAANDSLPLNVLPAAGGLAALQAISDAEQVRCGDMKLIDAQGRPVRYGVAYSGNGTFTILRAASPIPGTQPTLVVQHRGSAGTVERFAHRLFDGWRWVSAAPTVQRVKVTRGRYVGETFDVLDTRADGAVAIMPGWRKHWIKSDAYRAA